MIITIDTDRHTVGVDGDTGGVLLNYSIDMNDPAQYIGDFGSRMMVQGLPSCEMTLRIALDRMPPYRTLLDSTPPPPDRRIDIGAL